MYKNYGIVGFSFLCMFYMTSCTQKSTENQVIEWVSDHAIPLNTVLPGSNSDDLTPLKNIIGDARIVSLGEPTHGNREVFQLKHRMIEYLVTEMDFNIFALECPFGEALDINRYVVDGIGDPEKALAGIYFWTWDTEEVLTLIEWMRTYNSDPENVKKVKFYGFDPQDPQRATRVMLEYLEKVDPELEQSVRPELGILEVPFSDPIGAGRRQWIPEEYDSLSLRQIQRVMLAFQNKKESYVSSSSIKEWQLAKQHARQTEIYIESNINEGIAYGSMRDLGQAENIRWTLNHEGENAKIIVWAHNFHINNTISQEEEEREGLEYHLTECMGYHLKKWYHDQVMIIGFFYNQGEFTALDTEVPSKGMQTFSVGEAKTGSLENMMIKAGLTNAFLDLSEVPSDGVVSEWFNNPIPTRYSWGFYNKSEEDNYYYRHKLASEFDALIFLDKTTPTIPIDSLDYENIWLLDKKLSQPTNLDFEESEIGETPAGWFAWSKFKRLGVTMTTSDQAYQGKKSLMIYRPPGLAYGEIGPNVVQTIDATPYRGKKIRFKGVARVELEDDTFAFLHLKIVAGVQSAYSSELPLFDSLDKYRIKNSEWRHYSIEAEVAENADKITYSVNLRDFGAVWLDAVEIEIVE